MLKLYVFLLIKHSKAVKKQKIGKANFNFQQKYLCHKALCKIVAFLKIAGECLFTKISIMHTKIDRWKCKYYIVFSI